MVKPKDYLIILNDNFLIPFHPKIHILNLLKIQNPLKIS